MPPRLPNRDAIALALAASVGGMPKFEEALERPLLEGLTSWEIRVLIAFRVSMGILLEFRDFEILRF